MSEIDFTEETVEREISVREFVGRGVDVPRFLELCERCPDFGGRWTCPPFDFDPMDVWNRYERMLVIAKIYRLERPVPQSEGFEFVRRRKRDFEAELRAREAASPRSLMLSAGNCIVCESCARPSGEPCRYPDRARHSIEALGGNVGLLTEEYIGHKIQWYKDGERPDTFTLVGALLS